MRGLTRRRVDIFQFQLEIPIASLRSVVVNGQFRRGGHSNKELLDVGREHIDDLKLHVAQDLADDQGETLFSGKSKKGVDVFIPSNMQYQTYRLI
jgi:hypothetical protein